MNRYLQLIKCILIFCVSTNFSIANLLWVPGDYSTIQSAIDASQKGDTILVMPGDYHEFLVMKDSIVVMSDGEDDGEWNRALRTKIHSEGLRDSEDNITPVVNMADGSVIDGFEITGMDTVNHHLPGHSHAVQNRGASGTIMNCIVHDNGSTGIGSHEKDGRPAHPTIIHNEVYNNYGIGIGFNHFSKGLAFGNLVYQNRETGIGIQNGAAPIIENNVVFSNGWNGIAAREGAMPKVRFNWCYSNGIDPTGEGSPDGTGVGIGADSTGWMVKDGEEFSYMEVTGNIVYDNPSGGIMCRNMARVVIMQNEIYDNAGFQLAVNESGAAIDSNYIYNSPESNYEGAGIVITNGSVAEITKNNITGSNLAGIIVADGAESNIFGNAIYENKLSGIRIENTYNNIAIHNNIISGNQSPGVYVTNADAEIYRNLMEININGGVYISDTASGNVYNNTIIADEQMAGRGIYAGTSETKVMNNIVVGYQVGIFKNGSPEIDYNCTYLNQGYNGPPGTGGQNSVEANPDFVDPVNSNYYLNVTSPCIDRGNPDSFYNDPDGSRSDIGCYPYNPPISIEWNFDESEIDIYPSFASDVINVNIIENCDFDCNGFIEIYNLFGEKIQTIMVKEGINQIDISDLCSGVYFMNYCFGKEIGSSKFVKI
ncbi:MAG: right-handed parallel beta-helix repeat-containing protein [bacterium]